MPFTSLGQRAVGSIIGLAADLASRNEPDHYVEYIGNQLTQRALEALRRLLQSGARFETVVILTGGRGHEHALMLMREGRPDIVVQPGFTSDSGEGSRGLVRAIETLRAFDCELGGEVELDDPQWERMCRASLTSDDLMALSRPEKWRRGTGATFFYEHGRVFSERKHVVGDFDPTIPWGAIDERLLQIGERLFKDPDSALRDGYVQLEHIVAKRSSLKEKIGTRLYESAFAENGPLTWNGLHTREVTGRRQLFIGASQAYRNPLAHTVRPSSQQQDLATILSEFMLLNHLYLLERQATERRASV